MIIHSYDNSLAMVIGDNEELTVNVSGDYTYTDGDTVTISVKKYITDDTALFSRSATLDSDGSGTIAILPADTSGADPGTYWYDIQLVMASDIKTIVPLSKFKLIAEVTE